MKEQNLLIIKSSRRILFLDFNNIDLIAADGNYVRVYTGDRSYLVRETLHEICMRLPEPPFLRISRSSVINIRSIRELCSRRSRSMKVILANGQVCTWSRSYRPKLDRLVNQLRVV